MLDTYVVDLRLHVDHTHLHATAQGLLLTHGGMPIGQPHERPALKPHGKPIGLGFSEDQEFYRARTAPHLFEEWHADMVQEQATERALRSGLLNYDCHACKSTVLVTSDTSRCPTCHAHI